MKEKIEAGPLPIDDTLRIAIQIAKGLQAAHAKYIIHRDIKSANIILTEEGDIKIMDFGLAKRGGQTMLTKEGTTLGTVAYISPEQARGDDVDRRSDIFSLGVLLYETLTGQLPFKGDYDQAVTYSILNEEPEPVTGLRSGISMELERIIDKCLAKNKEERYQSLQELHADLRRLQDSSGRVIRKSVYPARPVKTKNRIIYLGFVAVILMMVVFVLHQGIRTEKTPNDLKSIAVLPFVDMSPDKDQEYFCDGIAEELISGLQSFRICMSQPEPPHFNSGWPMPITSMGIGSSCHHAKLIQGQERGRESA